MASTGNEKYPYTNTHVCHAHTYTHTEAGRLGIFYVPCLRSRPIQNEDFDFRGGRQIGR